MSRVAEGSLFAGLFGSEASKRANEEYQRAIKEAAHDAEAGSKPTSNEKESELKCWIN